MANGEYPPLSIFSPEKIFGDTSYSAEITIKGQLSSLSEDSTEASSVMDIYSGKKGQINSQNNTIHLKAITDPKKLPPINLMNWMIVIKEKH